MSKKLIAGIIILGIILLFGLIFGIRAIRNFIIIQNIFSENEENIEKDNYYLKTTVSYNGVTSVTKTYYKDGVGKMVAENGIYTWVDGKDAYMVDEANKTLYILDLNSSLGLVSYEMFVSLIPGYNKNVFQKFIMTGNLQNSIKTEKVDEKKCYKITIKEDNSTKTYWIEKNSSKPIKARVEFDTGAIYEYDYELRFNVVGIKDVELPKTDEYQKIEIKTND